MFRSNSVIQKSTRLTCAWVPTGNPNQPLACVWLDSIARTSRSAAASSSNEELGRMLLCA